MSQSIVPPETALPPEKTVSVETSLPETRWDDLPHSDDNDFHYRPMPVLAPTSLFLGICAFSGLISLTGLGVGLLGVIIGVIAIVQNARAQGELSGLPMAMIGLALSTTFVGWGAYMHYDDYVSELPPGYLRVNFPRDIAEKEFIIASGQRHLHPNVKPLIGKKVFLKGYIWESRFSTQFVLLKDNGKCCMGGDPAPNDFIEIQMPPGQTVQYMTGLVAVAGVLEANPMPRPGDPVYTMQADMVGKARSPF